MKKLITLLMVVLMVLALCACGDEDIAELKEENAKLKAKILELQIQLNKISDKTDSSKKPDEDATSGFKEVNLGGSETLDFAVMTFESAGWSDELNPTDTSGVYSYHADKEGESYFWLSGNLKNTWGNSYQVDNIYAEITFNDAYTYTARLIADDGGNDFYGDNVNPLKTIKYYIYASCPDEVKSIYKTATVKFGFKDNFERQSGSDWSKFDNLFTITLYK